MTILVSTIMCDTLYRFPKTRKKFTKKKRVSHFMKARRRHLHTFCTDRPLLSECKTNCEVTFGSMRVGCEFVERWLNLQNLNKHYAK